MELNFEKEHIKREAESKFKPSEEFLETKKPLEYSFRFSTGEKLVATQSNRGGGIIIIERGGEEIFNFGSLLPEGYKFVTPTYFKKHPKEGRLFDYLDNDWCESAQRKLILLGEFKSPRDILTLLHEIGHAHDKEDQELRDTLEEDYYQALKDKDMVLRVLLKEDMAKIVSGSERKAWAWALSNMKLIQKETGVDLKGLFPSFSALKQHISDLLATHRRPYEWIIVKDYDENFYKELQTYFDRWQYDSK